MRKEKRILSICMAALVVLLAIAGCGKKESLVGKWVYTDETTGEIGTMELFSDGTGIIAAGTLSYSCEWAIESGKLKIEIDTGIFGKTSHAYDYELDGDTLTFSNGDEVATYTRE
ncbi:MAG: hypothetical protein HDR21_13275 [Lachnospiraceae bacterium]|nr:hypothetical protein [Lachnospiraceae bacterium]